MAEELAVITLVFLMKWGPWILVGGGIGLWSMVAIERRIEAARRHRQNALRGWIGATPPVREMLVPREENQPERPQTPRAGAGDYILAVAAIMLGTVWLFLRQ